MPIQLSFADGSVVLLEQSSDGESLQITDAAWSDPFGGVPDQANIDFVQTHGKWSLHEVSGDAPFALLIGSKIDAVHPVHNRFGKLSGVRFVIARQVLDFVVEWDECHITWNADEASLRQRGMIIGTNAERNEE